MPKRYKITRSKISFELHERLSRLFKKLQWPFTQEDRYTKIFDDYGQMLEWLSEEQQELILFLTEVFLYCPYEHYMKTLFDAISKIDPTHIDNSEEVFVLPLVAPDEVGEGKSAYQMVYPCRTEVLPRIKHIQIKNPRSFHDIGVFDMYHSSRTRALIIFLDDFIGTGETACKALAHFRDNYQHPDDTVVVASLIGQERGIQAVNKLGYAVHTARVMSRGISDCTRYPNKMFTDASVTLRIMGLLEDKLGYPATHHRRFGYEKSEALVAMTNTPDNTFPVFWTQNIVNGRKWPSPFPRIES